MCSSDLDAVSQIDEADDTSVISRSPTSFVVSIVKENDDKDRDNHVDIRGLQLLYLIEFWQLFALMGILAGVGLMTIK